MTNQLTQVAINNDIPKNEKLPLAPFGPTATLTGHHYFTDSTTATFNLDTDKDQLGIALSKKLNSAAAPKDPANPTSLNGPGLDGETYNATAVAWLKLMVESPLKYPTLVVGENRGGIAEVYRINTVGGNPPADCSAFPEGANFTMPYSAEYWFWAL